MLQTLHEIDVSTFVAREKMDDPAHWNICAMQSDLPILIECPRISRTALKSTITDIHCGLMDMLRLWSLSRENLSHFTKFK